MNPEELAAEIDRLFRSVLGGDAPATEVVEAAGTDYLDGIGRDEYHDAMEMVMEQYDVPEPMREPVYEQLDAEGTYTPEGLRQNIELVLQDEDITNTVQNSLEVSDYAEVHYGIDQQNETNVATADGDGSIAGRDQNGQFQTGDGTQVGDWNNGVVNQGDNSGQQAGNDATADDITSGDGNFVNDEYGTVSENAIAFGGGDATNTANDVWDESVNDSYNEDNVGNVTDSYNEDNVGNSSYEAEHSAEASLHADVDVTGSYNEDNDHHDIDESHNLDVVE